MLIMERPAANTVVIGKINGVIVLKSIISNPNFKNYLNAIYFLIIERDFSVSIIGPLPGLEYVLE